MYESRWRLKSIFKPCWKVNRNRNSHFVIRRRKAIKQKPTQTESSSRIFTSGFCSKEGLGYGQAKKFTFHPSLNKFLWLELPFVVATTRVHMYHMGVMYQTYLRTRGRAATGCKGTAMHTTCDQHMNVLDDIVINPRSPTPPT